MLDVGTLMGSLVGQTEQQTRQALRIADAMAPCVLTLDEVEKALSGATGSGQSDSGVSSRMFGTLLTWLNDHESEVFVVYTCNWQQGRQQGATHIRVTRGVISTCWPASEHEWHFLRFLRQMYLLGQFAEIGYGDPRLRHCADWDVCFGD